MLLTGEVQREYRRLYDDEGDTAPIDAVDFVAPHGLFVVIYDDGVPIGMGGWRRNGQDADHAEIGELKRMYVRDVARRRGVGRLLLAHLERTAAQAGIRQLILETGLAQPEAIALYRSSGYVDVPPFGYYVDHDDSVHLGKTL